MRTRHGDDPVGVAHLTGRSRPSPAVPRYPVAADLAPLVRWWWVPVWDVPPGEVHRQLVLQHPSCQLVVADSYARLYGVVSGCSTVGLEGRGWAVGAALQPAAGRLLLDRPVAGLTDGHVDLVDLLGDDGHRLVAAVRAAMAEDPHRPAAHVAATDHVAELLRTYLPVDAAGRAIDRVVALAQDCDVVRVDQLAAAVGCSERSLQRLCRDRLGLTPKWLLQRRRLHDAAAGLRDRDVDLASLAAELGYADQAHFTNDWTRVVGVPPGAYAADQ